MIYVLFVIIPMALALIIPQIGQIILLYPVYLFMLGLQKVMIFFGGKDYGRKKD